MFSLEHDPLMAQAFREDAQRRGCNKVVDASGLAVRQARTLAATMFEKGDHMPDGTVQQVRHKWFIASDGNAQFDRIVIKSDPAPWNTPEHRARAQKQLAILNAHMQQAKEREAYLCEVRNKVDSIMGKRQHDMLEAGQMTATGMLLMRQESERLVREAWLLAQPASWLPV